MVEPTPIPKYPDALRIAGRLFRAGLADHDYAITPDSVILTKEGIERLLLLAEKIPCIQRSLNDSQREKRSP